MSGGPAPGTITNALPPVLFNWLQDEDRALKQKLSGYNVTNYADGKQIPIAVYFRFPDTEERVRTFPHVAIDMVSINFDAERAHRAGQQILTWDLEQATPPVGQSLVAGDYPLPWILEYQLAAYSRQPVHDRQLTYLLYRLFPEQFGFLDMTAYDGTVRRADLLSVVRRDTVDQDKKRLYRNIFTVGISSEFYVYQVQYIQQVTQVDVKVDGYLTQPLTGVPDIVDQLVVT
jgi:hypothetical protein